MIKKENGKLINDYNRCINLHNDDICICHKDHTTCTPKYINRNISPCLCNFFQYINNTYGRTSAEAIVEYCAIHAIEHFPCGSDKSDRMIFCKILSLLDKYLDATLFLDIE